MKFMQDFPLVRHNNVKTLSCLFSGSAQSPPYGHEQLVSLLTNNSCLVPQTGMFDTRENCSSDDMYFTIKQFQYKINRDPLQQGTDSFPPSRG